MANPSSRLIYKITVVLLGGRITFISSTEPKMLKSDEFDAPKFDWTPVKGCDTLGYIDWNTVCAVSWRSEKVSEPASRMRKTTKPDIKVDLGDDA